MAGAVRARLRELLRPESPRRSRLVLRRFTQHAGQVLLHTGRPAAPHAAHMQQHAMYYTDPRAAAAAAVVGTQYAASQAPTLPTRKRSARATTQRARFGGSSGSSSDDDDEGAKPKRGQAPLTCVRGARGSRRRCSRASAARARRGRAARRAASRRWAARQAQSNRPLPRAPRCSPVPETRTQCAA